VSCHKLGNRIKPQSEKYYRFTSSNHRRLYVCPNLVKPNEYLNSIVHLSVYFQNQTPSVEFVSLRINTLRPQIKYPFHYMNKMEVESSPTRTDNIQSPLIQPTPEQGDGTDEVETNVIQNGILRLIDVTLLLRLAVIILTVASLVVHVIGKEHTRILNVLAAITFTTFLWNLCFIFMAAYFPHNWKRRSDSDEPQKPYRRVAPLNDAWLSGYIFMFTLWAKLDANTRENSQRYKIDAVFVLNCAVL
jgi:hypothetical protein